ncbi:MAG: hypothetical protein HRT45_15590, partial [Bdellovibrionales bacterium]|nr:hypothetical protein [Bdellovibrionales bacterium]
MNLSWVRQTKVLVVMGAIVCSSATFAANDDKSCSSELAGTSLEEGFEKLPPLDLDISNVRKGLDDLIAELNHRFEDDFAAVSSLENSEPATLAELKQLNDQVELLRAQIEAEAKTALEQLDVSSPFDRKALEGHKILYDRIRELDETVSERVQTLSDLGTQPDAEIYEPEVSETSLSEAIRESLGLTTDVDEEQPSQNDSSEVAETTAEEASGLEQSHEAGQPLEDAAPAIGEDNDSQANTSNSNEAQPENFADTPLADGDQTTKPSDALSDLGEPSSNGEIDFNEFVNKLFDPEKQAERSESQPAREPSQTSGNDSVSGEQSQSPSDLSEPTESDQSLQESGKSESTEASQNEPVSDKEMMDQMFQNPVEDKQPSTSGEKETADSEKVDPTDSADSQSGKEEANGAEQGTDENSDSDQTGKDQSEGSEDIL